MGETSPPLQLSRTGVRVRKQASTSPRRGISAFVAASKREVLPIASLSRLIESFVIVADIERHTKRTIGNKRERLSRLLWLAERDAWKQVGTRELQGFFLYLNHGHEEPGGRWGEVGKTPRVDQLKSLSSGSVKSYHATLRNFFRWCVREGELDSCPMDKIDTPVDRPDQVQPFTSEQVDALLRAAKKTVNPQRNEAMLLLMLDTGVRVSELCALTIGDVDFTSNLLTVRNGKGGKARTIPYGRNCKRALWTYTQTERRKALDTEPLFLSDRGPGAGAGFLTRRAVGLLVARLGPKAGIKAQRCSPHVFRHTFSVMMLRNGANIFSLKQALGHESMHIVQRYLALSQADLTAAHQLASPADRLKSSVERK